MGKYNLEDIENKLKEDNSWDEIGKTYGVKGSAVRRAYFRLKKKEEEDKSSDISPKVPEKVVPIIPRIRKPPLTQYQLVTKGDLFNLIVDALQEKVELDPNLMERLKNGFPKAPFGGSRKTKDGGWNSITYALFEVILSSKRFFMKEG